MNLEQYSPEELKELSMIELAFVILESKKQATSFKEIVKEMTGSLGYSQEELTSRLSQFYTDLNIDGRFICMGENTWGLRAWYPYEQIDEEVLPQPKPKKKRKKEEADDPIVLEDDFDDLDEELDDLDDIDDVDEDEDEDDFVEDEEIDEIFDEDDDVEEDELEKAAVFIEEDDEDLDEDDDKVEKL